MLESNQQLLGKTLGTCSIERIIGQGGMGVVYLARQQRPARHVAVKVLFPGSITNSQTQQLYLARFRREADIIATLEHINIVPVYEYGEQDGLAYLVMPYLQGGSLYDTLTQHGHLPLQQVVDYMNQIASGLDYAHTHGIIHRDLKPSNFLFHTDGRLLLTDFGIARITQNAAEVTGAPLTSVGALLGTPYYTAPEMFRGEQIDHRVDIYACGVLLYQLLSGQLPFDGNTPYTIIAKHMEELPPALHQTNALIPAAVDAVIQQALAKNRDERFSSIMQLAQALSNAASSANMGAIVSPNAPTLISSQPPKIPVSKTAAPETDAARSQNLRTVEERTLVTVLSIALDLATSLEETLDPEDISTLMARYHTQMQKVIFSHGGTCEILADDTMMAIFGLPQVYGNEAERACAAALALQEAMKHDQERLMLQMGINTGEVVMTGNPTPGKYSIKGEVVNSVTRLQQAANTGEILTDERTAQAVQAIYIFGEERSLKLKGRKQPVRVFPLIAVRSIRQMDRPKFVGRKQDILQLELLQARATEEHRPHLVSLIAPAGIGKSRLLEEFLARIDSSEGIQIATARCLPYGQSLAYWPLRSLLAELLNNTVDETHITDALIQGEQSSEAAARLVQQILTSLSAEEEESSDQEPIFSSWRLLIESLARKAPRIIVFEDLHWANDNLLNLVEQLMLTRAQVSLLVITLSRPELLERRPTWGGGRPNFVMLNLEPLSEIQTRELVGRLMTEFAPEIRERIVERSGGNPFFAIELIRVMVEQENDGKGQQTDILPDTVHAAILARLDRLPPQERRVIQVASVVGNTFSAATLKAILSDLSTSEIDSALDTLLTRNLISFADGVENAYTFRHTLIRDVAYGMLSRAERIRLHGAIVNSFDALETDQTDEYLELFAYHYREATELARQSAIPLELPFDLERIVRSKRRQKRGNWLDLDFS